MNRDVQILRDKVTKLVPMLSGKGIVVTQRGTGAFVESRHGQPVRVNIPFIPDDASEELIVAIEGFVDHEVGHLLFSTWSVITAALYPDPANLKKRDRRTHSLMNIIEDPMVERKMKERFPGSAHNTEQVGRYLLSKFTGPGLSVATDIQSITSILMVPTIRAWAGQQVFKDYMADKWPLMEQFAKCVGQDLIDRVAKCDKSQDCLDLAREMLARIKDAATPPESQNTDAGDDEGEGEDEGNSQSSSKESGEESGEQPQEEGEQSQEKKKGKPKKGDKKQDKEKDSKSGDAEEKPKSEEETSDEGKGEEASGEEQGDEAGEDEKSEGAEGDEGKGEEEKSDDPTGGSEGDADEKDEAGEEEDEAGKGSGSDEGEEEEDDASGDGEGQDGEGDEGDEGEGSEGSGDSDGEGSDGDEGSQDGDAGKGSEEPGEDAGQAEGEDTGPENKGKAAGSGQAPDPDAAGEIFSGMENMEDYDNQLGQAISDEAAGAIGAAPYRVFSKDIDLVEPLTVKNMEACQREVASVEDQMRQMVGVMAKDLERYIAAQTRSMNVPGFRTGRLHGASLAKLRVGDDRVFRHKEIHRSKDTAVSLVVDCSGSMGGRKIITAAQAAFVLGIVLERIGVKFEASGFTTCDMGKLEGNNEEWEKFCEERNKAEDQIGGRFSRYDIINAPIVKQFTDRMTPDIKAKFVALYKEVELGNNVDGESVEYAGFRLLRRTEQRKIMIVLSDGHPACYGDRDAARKHLIDTVTNMTRAGVEMIGIGIMDDSVRHFYPKWFQIDSIEQLPAKIVGEMSRLLMQNK